MQKLGDHALQQTRTTLGDVPYGTLTAEQAPPRFELIQMEEVKQTKLEQERKRLGHEYSEDDFNSAIDRYCSQVRAARAEKDSRYSTIALKQIYGQVLSLSETVRSLELMERHEVTEEQGQMLGSLFTYCSLALERTAKLMGHDYRPPLNINEIPTTP